MCSSGWLRFWCAMGCLQWFQRCLEAAMSVSEWFMTSSHTDPLCSPLLLKPYIFCQIQLEAGEQVLDYFVPAYYPKLSLINSHRKVKEKKKLLIVFIVLLLATASHVMKLQHTSECKNKRMSMSQMMTIYLVKK